MSALSDALWWWMQKVQTLEKAKDACAYDYGYFLAQEQEEVEQAEKEFLQALRTKLAVEVETDDLF